MIRCLTVHRTLGALLFKSTIGGAVLSTRYNGRFCSMCAPAMTDYRNSTDNNHHEKGYDFVNIKWFNAYHVKYPIHVEWPKYLKNANKSR